MKQLAVPLALFVALGSCNFAVKHPAVTAGIVAGSVAMVTCELASEAHKECAIAAGAVGVGLALIAGAALWLGSEDEAPEKEEPPPKIDWSKVPDTTPKQPTQAPPIPPDAGAPVDALPATTPSDAGAPVDAQ